MAMRPLLVIDNVPVFSFVQITIIEFSPLSCWVVRSPELFIHSTCPADVIDELL